ncbi:MAG: hypothetical protein D6725_01170 [Planctomycetota bacterium]|nr:MAG: hypothetical protein D6725_01170 [Planctomycetota bacterium]
MSYKVACGQCGGYLYAEQPGEWLRCPHCGTPLEIPPPENGDSADDRPFPGGTAPASTPPTAAHPKTTSKSDATTTATEQTEAPNIPATGQTEPASGPAVASTAASAPSSADIADDSVGHGVLDFPRRTATATTVNGEGPTLDAERRAPHDVTGPERAVPPGEPLAARPSGESPAEPGGQPIPVPLPSAEVERPTALDFTGGSPPAVGRTNDAAPPWSPPDISHEEMPPGTATETTEPNRLPNAAGVHRPAASTAFGESASAPVADANRPDRTDVVSRGAFLLLATYASAVTMALAYLLYVQLTGGQRVDPSNLESLPDVVPPTKDGRILYKLVPENAPMPPGHTLQLGQTQRFGNVRVTPLRVEWAPVEFVYYRPVDGDSAADPGAFDAPQRRRRRRPARPPTKPPTAPTLRLWLRFENVSRDQHFIPLGHALAWRRFTMKDGRQRANQFVCRRERKATGPYVLLMDFPPEDVWELKDNRIGQQLGPGEACELYLPADPDDVRRLFVDAGEPNGLPTDAGPPFDGSFIWRVHFRKGYHPQTRRGVTTVIEVAFEGHQIVRG